jgi:hypothetical protein
MTSQYVNTLVMRSVVILANIIFILYDEIQQLEDLHNSLNQLLLSDQYIISQNHICTKDPVK